MAQQKVPTRIRSCGDLGIRLDDAVARSTTSSRTQRHLQIVSPKGDQQSSAAPFPLHVLPQFSFEPTPQVETHTQQVSQPHVLIGEEDQAEESLGAVLQQAAEVVAEGRGDDQPMQVDTQVASAAVPHNRSDELPRYRLTHRGQRVVVTLGFIGSIVVGGIVGGVINLVTPDQPAHVIVEDSTAVASDSLTP